MSSNALQQNNTPPPAPRPNSLQANGVTPSDQPQPAPPVLSHQEAVTALRHFGAIQRELEEILQNPQLGKADLKKSIIDGTTKLVGERIITPANAVMQLATVPDDPKEQKAWLVQNYQNTMMSQLAVIEHHRNGNQGTQDWATESQADNGSADNHLETMDGIMSRYKGAS